MLGSYRTANFFFIFYLKDSNIHSFAAYYLIRKKIKSNFFKKNFHANYFPNIGKKETSKKEPAKKGVAPQPKSGNYLGLLSFFCTS